MADVKKFPNEKPWIYGKCSCGCDLFRFIMNASDYTVVRLIQCSGCKATAPTMPEGEIDLEIIVE